MNTPVPAMELRGSVCAFVFDICSGERCRRIDGLPICGVFAMCAAEYVACSEYQRLIGEKVRSGAPGDTGQR